MPKRSNRERRRVRRTPFRTPKPRLLVVCEGVNTESEYLRGFVRWCRNPRVDVEIAKAHGVPKTLVIEAKELKQEAARQGTEYDSVWCVFDVDEHPHFPDAQQMARDSGIDLAISNPCFELWLLLHFRESPGMQHRGELRKLLKLHIADYDKHVDFADFRDGYSAAVVRAKRLAEMAAADNESGRDPTTDVYRLTEIIRE